MAEASGLMRGKRGLIMGVANNRSIAWGIAKACRAQGAELGLHLSGRRAEEARRAAGRRRSARWSSAIATSPSRRRSTRSSRPLRRPGARSISSSTPSPSPTRTSSTAATSTPRADNFTKTMLISCYSFTAIAQRAEKLMPNGGSLLTLTYYGAEKWMPHYNVMGVAKAALEASVRYLAADLGAKNIRVNAISAGPIKTLAASGIGDFRYILKWNEYNAPLRRNVTIEEVGRRRGLSAVRHVARRHRRNPSCRCRLPHRRHEASRRARHRRHHGQGLRRRHPTCRSPSSISSATARPTGTASSRLQGQHDIPLNALGRTQAARCGAILRDLLARDGRRGADFDYVSSPLGRARETMELMRAALGLEPAAYRTDARLMEMSFGRWEGFTYRRAAGCARPRRSRRASATNGALCCPAAKATRSSRRGCAPGTRARARHRGGGAWRRLPRADRASRHRAAEEAARSAISGRAWSTCSTDDDDAPRIAPCRYADSLDRRVALKRKAAGLSSGRLSEIPCRRLAEFRRMLRSQIADASADDRGRLLLAFAFFFGFFLHRPWLVILWWS